LNSSTLAGEQRTKDGTMSTAAVPKKKSGKCKATEEVAATAPAAAYEPFDTSRLRSKLKINDGKIAQVRDNRYQGTRSISKNYFLSGIVDSFLDAAFSVYSLAHVRAYSLSQRQSRTRLQQMQSICQ
jgi:hypothetical protein